MSVGSADEEIPERIPNHPGLRRKPIAGIFPVDDRSVAVIGGKLQAIVAEAARERQRAKRTPGVVDVNTLVVERSAEIVRRRRNVEESGGEGRRIIEAIAGVEFAGLKTRAENKRVLLPCSQIWFSSPV